jgi:hypothetical protein
MPAVKPLSPTAARALAGGAGLVIGFLAACGPFNPPSTSCTKDADCGLDTLHCTAEGHCEERCAYPQHWCGDRCAQCCDDQACAPYGHCTTAGICEPDCQAGQRFCVLDGGEGACAECCGDADCGSRGPCLNGRCGCRSDQKLCKGECIPADFCCVEPAGRNDDCPGGLTCDGGLCCDYIGLGEDGGNIGCRSWNP